MEKTVGQGGPPQIPQGGRLYHQRGVASVRFPGLPDQGALLVGVGERERRIGSELVAAVVLSSVNQPQRSIKAPPPAAAQGDARIAPDLCRPVLPSSVTQPQRSIKAPPPAAAQGDAGPCFHHQGRATVGN